MSRGRIKGKQIEDNTLDESKLSFDMYYNKTFTSATLWTVNHNLNRYVGVDIYNTDTTPKIIEGEIERVNDNTVRVHFNSPTSGTVIIT